MLCNLCRRVADVARQKVCLVRACVRKTSFKINRMVGRILTRITNHALSLVCVIYED